MFRSGVQPRNLWNEARVIESEARQLRVFRWENRLVCHEEASECWWATFDEFGDDDARAFWERSIDNGRIARLVTVKRGFELNNGNAHLSLDARCFDVLIAANNGGWARAEGEWQWHQFAPIASRRVRKPLARVPSIWSPRFSIEFGRVSMRNLAPRIAEEILASAPLGARELWQHGANTRSIRLAIAANAQAWIEHNYRAQSAPEFWEMAVLKASRRLPPNLTHLLHSLGRNPFSLPATMQQSPELAPQLRIYISKLARPSHHKDWAAWREKSFSIRIEFWPQLDSAHEILEAKLELRDWLSQFFPADEVNQWLQ